MDQSTNQTVVEYAVQEMFKNKSIQAAAKSTTKKLHGRENFFIGPGVVEIDAKRLEEALWERLVDFTIANLAHMKVGFEHYALDGTVLHFKQPKGRAELKRRVVSKLGCDPFSADSTCPV